MAERFFDLQAEFLAAWTSRQAGILQASRRLPERGDMLAQLQAAHASSHRGILSKPRPLPLFLRLDLVTQLGEIDREYRKAHRQGPWDDRLQPGVRSAGAAEVLAYNNVGHMAPRTKTRR